MQKPKTIICDIDGTLFFHRGSLTKQYIQDPEILEGTVDKINEWDRKGYNIILMTGRRESMRKETEKLLKKHGIFFDTLIMGVGGGDRVVINDMKEGSTVPTTASISLKRNEGIKDVDI